MKTVLTFLAVVSVGLNLVLLGAFLFGRGVRSATPLRVEEHPAPSAPAGPVVTGETWNTLRSADDLPAMVQRLRENGFPPDLVRAIMAAHLRETYAARMQALDPGAASRPFWKSTAIDPRVQQAQNAMYREQRKLLRELLGADADPNENINAIFQGRRLDSVPADKVDEVRRLLRQQEEARTDVYLNAGGGMMTTDMQRKLREVDKAHQDALAQLLTPAELEAFNLRNSDTARQLRGNLTAFNPTEQEFQTLFKLQSEFDARYSNNYGLMSPEEQRQRMDAQRQLTEQIKAALGPVRGEDYARTTDFSYRQASQLVARLELPADTTARIWDVKKDIEERSGAIHRDRSLAPDDRNARLAALAEESTARLSSLLGGPRGVEALKQNGAYWLTNLTPRPSSAGAVRIAPPP